MAAWEQKREIADPQHRGNPSHVRYSQVDMDVECLVQHMPFLMFYGCVFLENFKPWEKKCIIRVNNKHKGTRYRRVCYLWAVVYDFISMGGIYQKTPFCIKKNLLYFYTVFCKNVWKYNKTSYYSLTDKKENFQIFQ